MLQDHTTPHRSLYNGAVLIDYKTIKNVVSSAAEAETHGIFNNAKTTLYLRHILSNLGHEQPSTIIRTDNSTTKGFVDSKIQLRKSKSWDMNLYWLKEKAVHKIIKVLWEKGS